MEESPPNSPDLTVVKEALVGVVWLGVAAVVLLFSLLDRMDSPDHASTLHAVLVVALPVVSSVLWISQHALKTGTRTAARVAAAAVFVAWVVAVVTL